MAIRASKKAEPKARRMAAGSRRSDRPRAATAASKIYSDLRSELVSLQRRPGEAIAEAQIALSYGVSRTPVREAILKLSDEGLLEIYPQSGIFVARIPVAALPERTVARAAPRERDTRQTEGARSARTAALSPSDSTCRDCGASSSSSASAENRRATPPAAAGH